MKCKIEKRATANCCSSQRVDKVYMPADFRHAGRLSKKAAGEEGRSRQYDGTAMSHDEASKVPQIKDFGNCIDKINEKFSPAFYSIFF